MRVGDLPGNVNNRVFNAVDKSDPNVDLDSEAAQHEIDLRVSAMLGSGYNNQVAGSAMTGGPYGASSRRNAYTAKKKNLDPSVRYQSPEENFGVQLLKYDWGRELADSYQAIRDRVEEDPNYTQSDANQDEAMKLIRILKQKLEATGQNIDEVIFQAVNPHSYERRTSTNLGLSSEWRERESVEMSFADLMSKVLEGVEGSVGDKRRLTDRDIGHRTGRYLLKWQEFFKSERFDEFLGDDYVNQFIIYRGANVDPSYYGRIVADPGTKNYKSPRTEFRRGY